MRKAIVSVLLGKYDDLKPAPKFSGWECIMFTNNTYKNSLGWEIRKVRSKNPLVDSRYYKWMTHKTLKDYDTVCYIDGSMVLKVRPPNCETWFIHPKRANVTVEAKQILGYYPELENIITLQLNAYKLDGFKDNYGLYQNGFFVREHKKDTNDLCEMVYKIAREFCHRDQLAMPYALYKTNYKMARVIDGLLSHKWIFINFHK